MPASDEAVAILAARREAGERQRWVIRKLPSGAWAAASPFGGVHVAPTREQAAAVINL